MRVFLAGGGTGGPITPLLAVAEVLQKLEPKAEFFFVGRRRGIERKFLDQTTIPMKYLTIPSGKWRRYFSFLNLTDIFKTFFGFLKSLYLISRYKPDIIFGAGSYVQVPLSYAGFLLRKPVVVHQQDFQVLLSTRLVVPIATAVTVSFRYSGKNIPEASGLLAKIPKSKIYVTGNPCRREVLLGSAEEARKIFDLNADYPTVLVMGGGTGSKRLNAIILEALPELTKYGQIIHVTGGRMPLPEPVNLPNYHQYPFLGPELKHAYAVADLVISRGGMSTITELSHLGKVCIFVPLPKSHQEDNVRFLAMLGLAVGVAEEFFEPELLVKLVRKLIWDHNAQKTIQENFPKLMPKDSDREIAKILRKICREQKQKYGK